MAMGVKTRLDDLTTVLSQTQDHRHRVLVRVPKYLGFMERVPKYCQYSAKDLG